MVRGQVQGCSVMCIKSQTSAQQESRKGRTTQSPLQKQADLQMSLYNQKVLKEACMSTGFQATLEPCNSKMRRDVGNPNYNY